jgi:hypothetical protein
MTAFRIRKNPKRVRFLKVRLETKNRRWPSITILRPPSRLDYLPSLVTETYTPPYARRLAHFWNPSQWSFATRPRWLFRVELDRNWYDVNGRIIVCGRVVWWGKNWGNTYKFLQRQRFVDWWEVKHRIQIAEMGEKFQ